MTREGLINVYEQIGYITIAIGVAVLLVSPLVKRLMHLDTLKDEETAEESVAKAYEEQFALVDLGRSTGPDGVFQRRRSKDRVGHTCVEASGKGPRAVSVNI
jgi:hypothetical protein